MAKRLLSETSCRVICFERAFCGLRNDGATRDWRWQHLTLSRIHPWQRSLGRWDAQLGSEQRSADRRFLRRGNPQSVHRNRFTDAGSAGKYHE
jgi:hypothetical protein